MKYLLAFLPHDLLHRVKEALIRDHIHGMTVSVASGFGQEHDNAHPEHHEYLGLELTKKVRLEIICHDDEVDHILDAIYSASHTGHAGDGKVFVLPVLDALRVKTGERGPAALGPTINSGTDPEL
jgi:nitrogen regulatory protein P-II 1